MINEWDSTDAGVDYGLPDYSDGYSGDTGHGGGFNINIPSGVNISLGGGPIVNTPSVPQYPATAPAVYQRGPYSNTAVIPGAFAGNTLLWVIIAAAIIYVFVSN